jgi:hypothetical protein
MYMDNFNVEWLLVSLLALVIGPILYQLAHQLKSMLAALDGFVFATICGLVVLHLIPDSIGRAGWWALVWALAGLLGPGLIERRLKGLAQQAHVVALFLALVGIGLHAFMDGWALVAPQEAGEAAHHHMLPMAVVLHRLPVGLTIWFLLRPLYGVGVAIAALGLIVVATTAGFAFSGVLEIESRGWGLFQALVAGSLLHVVVHRSYPIAEQDISVLRRRFAAGLGAVAGLAFLWSITLDHGFAPTLRVASEIFYTLARESAPALLLAYVAAGLVYGLLPAASVAWMSRGGNLSQAFRGIAFGLPIPVCSCGVVPVYRSLVHQGVTLSAAMSFLVATPELSFDAVMITLPVLGGEFTVVRIVCVVVVALAMGWGMGKLAGVAKPVPLSQGSIQGEGTTDYWPRFKKGMRSGLGEVVDSTAPWIIVGLAIAALMAPLLEGKWLAHIPPSAEVGLFALLGIPTYVCASGATPLVAVLVYKGVSPGAGLAFLLTGPATNITTFGVLSDLHGRRIAVVFGSAIIGLAVGAGCLVNGFMPVIEVSPILESEDGGWWSLQGISLALLAGLFLISLMRQGPRAFVGELFPIYDHDHADHDHADHDHEDSCHEDHCSHC